MRDCQSLLTFNIWNLSKYYFYLLNSARHFGNRMLWWYLFGVISCLFWHSDNWVRQTAVGKHHRLCDLTALPCSQTLASNRIDAMFTTQLSSCDTVYRLRHQIGHLSFFVWDAMIFFLLLFNHIDYSKESVFCPPEDLAFLFAALLLYFFKINVMVDSWAYITKGLTLPHENCNHSEQKYHVGWEKMAWGT